MAKPCGKCRTVNAVVLGGMAWNTMIYVDRFPEPIAQTVFASRMHQTIGGSGAGKALNLRSLGADVSLWALIGDDEPGINARAVLDYAGVRLLSELDPKGTPQHINLMDAAGDRISIFANPRSLSTTVDPDPVQGVIDSADLIAVTIHDHCRAFLPLTAEADADTWIDIHDYDGRTPYHGEFIDAADLLFMSSVAMVDWMLFLEGRIALGTRAAVAPMAHSAPPALPLRTVG
jgi:sugar/nucleoside kinase (ribokinase family)